MDSFRSLYLNSIRTIWWFSHGAGLDIVKNRGNLFMQKLANIVLKMDKIGSSVQKNYVTPAEVMWLVADHHANAGGDPIIKLVEIKEDDEVKQMAPVQAELDSLNEELSALDDIELTDEIRERRERSFHNRIDSKERIIKQLQSIINLRNLPPAKERDRLVARYGSIRIKKFYPGAIPNLPTTFEEAREQGVSADATPARMLDSSLALIGDVQS